MDIFQYINILYEDVHLIVLNKPAGILSQSDSSGSKSLVDWLRQHFNRNYVGLIHRLDRNTSGLMVISKRSKSAERLSRDLRVSKIRRSYLAWVEGHLDRPVLWDWSLSKDLEKNLVRISENSYSKEAKTEAIPKKKMVKSGNLYTLIEFHLDTGRSHQIRAHSSAAGFPLVGDVKYGGKNLA